MMALAGNTVLTRDYRVNNLDYEISIQWGTINGVLSEFTTEEAPDDRARILDATKSVITINIYLMLGAPK